MYEEDDLLPLSRLADLEFCERRAALHLVEGVWEDNVHTAQGTVLHDKVHETEGIESRGDVRIARGLWVRSLRLGLSGKCDVVEFRFSDQLSVNSDQSSVIEKRVGVEIAGAPGLWRPYPVEYKPGRLKHQESFQIQLCAQAMCLEEMMGVRIAAGALFYGKTRRRLEVGFDEGLRGKTETAARRLHELVESGRTPAAQYGKKCESCSLLELCAPRVTGGGHSAARYLSEAVSGMKQG